MIGRPKVPLVLTTPEQSGARLVGPSGAHRAPGRSSSATIYYLQVPALLRINGGSRSTGGVSAYGIFGPAIDLNPDNSRRGRLQ